MGETGAGHHTNVVVHLHCTTECLRVDGLACRGRLVVKVGKGSWLHLRQPGSKHCSTSYAFSKVTSVTRFQPSPETEEMEAPADSSNSHDGQYRRGRRQPVTLQASMRMGALLTDWLMTSRSAVSMEATTESIKRCTCAQGNRLLARS